MKIKTLFIISILLSSFLFAISQTDKKISINRTKSSPIIDGYISKEEWGNSETVSSFVQYDPFWGENPKFQTEVNVLYDDKAIYIAARMFDAHPDSINKQIGLRDESLHADYFAIEFDPFNRMQESYYFQVTSSGVQTDWIKSDASYNAVWKSSVKIDSLGWCCEIEIPFSAFSFLKSNEQIWRMQFYRYIRRNRELSQWCLVSKTDDNSIKYWSVSENLSDITPPLRLFLQPYINATIIGAPNQENNLNWDHSFKGGMDLKWGINQSYSLEMSLLPDFSQVQSDNVIKNLSAFETVYSDYRPFFNESISFFTKGGLLYTRRIGGKPSGYNNIESQLDSNEYIVSNPSNSPLINAFKLYGKNKNGISIGIFNAITNKTEAIVKDNDEHVRKIQTEPLTNFTIFVAEKAFRNKSNVFFSNANTIRQGLSTQANVTATGGSLYLRNGFFKIYFLGGLSRRSYQVNQLWNSNATNGFKYDFSLAKVSGKLIYSLNRYFKDEIYNPNDLGVNLVNNEASNNFTISHRIVNPFWRLLNLQNTFTLDYANRVTTQKMTNFAMKYTIFTTNTNHLTLWSGINWRPNKIFDYYEPRNNGYYFLAPRYVSFNFNFSSDYRKPVAFDGAYVYTNVYDYNGVNQSITFTPVLRIGNKIGMRLSNSFAINSGQRGYVETLNSGDIIFGNRVVKTFENIYSINYMLSSNLGIIFKGRYYWTQGKYSDFYMLQTDGLLSDIIPNYTQNKDFTYSVFNIDLSLNWEFAPGSKLFFIYKNEFINEVLNANKSYLDYLRYSFDMPQQYTFALKFLYHFNVGTLVRKK